MTTYGAPINIVMKAYQQYWLHNYFTNYLQAPKQVGADYWNQSNVYSLSLAPILMFTM